MIHRIFNVNICDLPITSSQTICLHTLWWSLKMAATGRGSLRPYQPNKARNFFVAGLLFVVMVLSYNYWIASATKNQLAYDISSLQVSLQKLRLADSQLKVGDVLQFRIISAIMCGAIVEVHVTAP